MRLLHRRLIVLHGAREVLLTAAEAASAAALSQDDMAMMASEPSSIDATRPPGARRAHGRKSRIMYIQKTKMPTDTAAE